MPFFAFGEFACRAIRHRIETDREQAFDGAPAPAEIGIAVWQLSNGVEMIRQHANGDGVERMTGLCDAVGAAQPVDVFHQQTATAVSQRDGEEERAASCKAAPVTGHVSPPESRPAAIRDKSCLSAYTCRTQGRVGNAKRAHAEKARVTDRYWPRVVEPAWARPDGLCPPYGSLLNVDQTSIKFKVPRSLSVRNRQTLFLQLITRHPKS